MALKDAQRKRKRPDSAMTRYHGSDFRWQYLKCNACDTLRPLKRSDRLKFGHTPKCACGGATHIESERG